MDGGGAFNDEAEENVELEFSAAGVMRFAANAASNGRVLLVARVRISSTFRWQSNPPIHEQLQLDEQLRPSCCHVLFR
jgi:hypothetical protein